MNVPVSRDTTLHYSEGKLGVLEESGVLPDASTSKYTRRTVVRGAAWSVPVIAVAAQAPAFATSPVPPKFGELSACKLPGKSTDTDFGYRFTVPYNGTLGQLSIVSLKLNGRDYTPTNIVADGTNLTFIVRSTNSADGEGTGTVTFTFNGQSYTETFDYDGTKPCKF